MFNVHRVREDWNNDFFHLHLDLNGQDQEVHVLKGWLVNKTDNGVGIFVVSKEGRRATKVALGKSRPKLPFLYPNIEGLQHAGFDIYLNDLSECENCSIVVFIDDELLLEVPILSNEPTPLLYVHIAKTAGSTVNKSLSSFFLSERSLVHVESIPEWKDEVKKGGVRFISGHIPYKVFMQTDELLSFKKAITFREPYAHIASHLSWIRALTLEENEEKYNAHPLYIQNLSNKLSGCDFSDPKSLSEMVAGLEGAEYYLLDNTQTRYIRNDISKKSVDQSDVYDSICNLQEFDFIGLDKDINKFLQKIEKFYGAKDFFFNSSENVSSEKFGLDVSSEEIRSALHPLVCYDIELYGSCVNGKIKCSVCFRSLSN